MTFVAAAAALAVSACRWVAGMGGIAAESGRGAAGRLKGDMVVQAITGGATVSLRRLFWVGPAALCAAVLAVAIIQRIALAMIDSLPAPFRFPMTSIEPLVLIALLVAGAVVVFAIVGDVALNPIRTFKRIALTVLLLSFIPNIFAAMSWGAGSWQPAIALAVMHVAAWAVTVTMVTRLGTVQRDALS